MRHTRIKYLGDSGDSSDTSFYFIHVRARVAIAAESVTSVTSVTSWQQSGSTLPAGISAASTVAGSARGKGRAY